MWNKVSFGAKWAAALSDQLKKGMKMRKTRIHFDTLKKVCNKTERESCQHASDVFKEGFSASKPKKKKKTKS